MSGRPHAAPFFSAILFLVNTERIERARERAAEDAAEPRLSRRPARSASAQAPARHRRSAGAAVALLRDPRTPRRPRGRRPSARGRAPGLDRRPFRLGPRARSAPAPRPMVWPCSRWLAAHAPDQVTLDSGQSRPGARWRAGRPGRPQLCRGPGRGRRDRSRRLARRGGLRCTPSGLCHERDRGP